MKAFSKLDKLSEPEAFEGWLGTIVANTAKNALVRKNPLLFTDVAVDNEGEEFTYDVEDENPDNQPEMAYTREETRELVHSLMDSLSEEQRLCILMFHIEGASILEIAEAMDCSENTVKSRLNYGRKISKLKQKNCRKKATSSTVWLRLYFLYTCFVPTERLWQQKIQAKLPAVPTSELQNLWEMQPRVTFKGNYSGTFSRSYTINPQATYITRLSKLSKGFAVNLRRLSSATATGYQVQYSLYRNFKGAKVKVLRGTSMNIRGLQGNKNYYVRIRAYKGSGGRAYYSAWSGVKIVRTRR